MDDLSPRWTAADPEDAPRAAFLGKSMAELALIARFAAVGVVNTLVGLSVTLALDLGLKVSPAWSNAAGYAVGIVVSWFLQRRFVFRSNRSGWRDKVRFLTVVGISFVVNQLVLRLLHSLLGDAELARAAAQVGAMASYTIVQFLLLRLWVFVTHERAAEPPAA